MLDRIRAASLPSLSLPSIALPSLGNAVQSARSAVGRGAHAASDLCASVSSFATDALQRVERPSFDWLPELSFPAWFAGGVRQSSSDPLLVSVASSAPSTIEGWENAVGKSGLTWGHFFPMEGKNWSDEVDIDGLALFLRAQHPDKTAVNVAARAKLPADTVKKWLCGAALPNGRAMLVLACAYGPEVMVAMLRNPPGWLDEAAQAAKHARLTAQVVALQAKIGAAA